MATTVKIDDELTARVGHLAGDRSLHDVIGEAVTQYVEREEARYSFESEASRSWAQFQETGRHLTGDEVRTWLASWGTDTEAPSPECHE